MPSRTTTGKSTCESPTVRSTRYGVNSLPGMKIGMITPAPTMNSAVSAPSTSRMIQNSVEASRIASRRRRCSRYSAKIGTNAALSAASANRPRTRLGTWKAIVNADAGPARAEVAGRDDLAREACDAREPRRDREDRRVARHARTRGRGTLPLRLRGGRLLGVEVLHGTARSERPGGGVHVR